MGRKKIQTKVIKKQIKEKPKMLFKLKERIFLLLKIKWPYFIKLYPPTEAKKTNK